MEDKKAIVNDVFEKFGMKDSKKARVSKGMFCDGQTAYKYCFICSDPDEVARVRRNVKNELLNNYILDVHTLQENRNGIFVLDRIIYEKWYSVRLKESNDNEQNRGN